MTKERRQEFAPFGMRTREQCSVSLGEFVIGMLSVPDPDGQITGERFRKLVRDHVATLGHFVPAPPPARAFVFGYREEFVRVEASKCYVAHDAESNGLLAVPMRADGWPAGPDAVVDVDLEEAQAEDPSFLLNCYRAGIFWSGPHTLRRDA